MSYEKLGFTKGQTLKADHLNHMEEGIANAGGCGFEYYTGEVELATNSTNAFIFSELNMDMLCEDYYEMEVGVVVNQDSKQAPFFKYTFIFPKARSSFWNVHQAVENDLSAYYPSATLSDDGCAKFTLSASGYSGAINVANPSISFIRLYKRV